MLFTEFKKATKDNKLQENQLKELEQKLNDETSKGMTLLKRLEASNETRNKKVPRVFRTYSWLDEVFMEGFGLIGPYDDLLSETDSEDEEHTECQFCLIEFKPTEKYIPCKLKYPSGVVCPLCVEFWMASKVSF